MAVASFGKIEEAESGQLAFLANPKYEDYLYTTEASIIIINDSLEIKPGLTATLSGCQMLQCFCPAAAQIPADDDPAATGIQQPVIFHPVPRSGRMYLSVPLLISGTCVEIGDNAKIYPQVFIGNNAKIGR